MIIIYLSDVGLQYYMTATYGGQPPTCLRHTQKCFWLFLFFISFIFRKQFTASCFSETLPSSPNKFPFVDPTNNIFSNGAPIENTSKIPLFLKLFSKLKTENTFHLTISSFSSSILILIQLVFSVKFFFLYYIAQMEWSNPMSVIFCKQVSLGQAKHLCYVDIHLQSC